MNVRFGDTGLVVDYIQSFLINNYSNSLGISGIYDRETHNALLKYLAINNVRDIDYIYNAIISEISDIERYFISYKNPDNVIFYSKSDNEDTLSYMESIRDKITEVSDNCGWKIVEYRTYQVNGRFKILINKLNYENILPNKDMLPFINLSTDYYKYNMKISESGDVLFDYSTNGKLLLVECKPNTNYIISHAYNDVINMKVACTRYKISKFNNVLCTKLDNIYLGPGQLYTFTTNDDANTIVIEVPTNSVSSITVSVIRGDATLDGKINEDDLLLISSHLNGSSDMTRSQILAAMVSQNIDPADPDPEVTINDYAELYKYLYSVYPEGYTPQPEQVSHVGERLNLQIELYNSSNDTNMILVTEKHDNIGAEQILHEFKDLRWSLYDRFLDYISGMAITEYSTEENIKYAQELLSKVYTADEIVCNGIFTDETRDFIHNYQMSKGISFALGYLDSDTESELVRDVNNDKILLYNREYDNYDWR